MRQQFSVIAAGEAWEDARIGMLASACALGPAPCSLQAAEFYSTTATLIASHGTLRMRSCKRFKLHRSATLHVYTATVKACCATSLQPHVIQGHCGLCTQPLSNSCRPFGIQVQHHGQATSVRTVATSMLAEAATTGIITKL